MTLPRIKVLELFQRSERRHLTAEDVYRQMTDLGGDLGLATVYRVLSPMPNMRYIRNQVIDVVAWALRGLDALEPNGEKRLKYRGFIDAYSELDDNEYQQFAQRYPQEESTMTSIAQRAMAQGLQLGRQERRQEVEADVLLRQLTRRFGPLGAPMTERVRQANSAELEQWLDNFVDAHSLQEVFGDD